MLLTEDTPIDVRDGWGLGLGWEMVNVAICVWVAAAIPVGVIEVAAALHAAKIRMTPNPTSTKTIVFRMEKIIFPNWGSSRGK